MFGEHFFAFHLIPSIAESFWYFQTNVITQELYNTSNMSGCHQKYFLLLSKYKVPNYVCKYIAKVLVIEESYKSSPTQ
jgi:hypothetical protein